MICVPRLLAAATVLTISSAVAGAQSEAMQNPHDRNSRYTHMAPLEQYLIPDRTSEIAFARSAAPASISGHADVLVLGTHGYEVAVSGSNGFVCFVDRAWTSDPNDPDYMNPSAREPTCFNAAAARTILPRVYRKTRLAFEGVSKREMLDSVRIAYSKGELPAPDRGAMSYMMSQHTYFGPVYGKGGPHLMFYFPTTDSLAWGGGLPKSPVIVHQDYPAPTTTFVIMLAHWADGTPVAASSPAGR